MSVGSSFPKEIEMITSEESGVTVKLYLVIDA